MAGPRKKSGDDEARFGSLASRKQDVEAITSSTKAAGEAASSAPSANIRTRPAANQRAHLNMRMLQVHKLEFEDYLYKVWISTGKRPSLQKMLDEATAIMHYVLGSSIPGEADLAGKSLSEYVISQLRGNRKRARN